MDYLYAQLNIDNICIGVSQLCGEVEASDMIALTKQEYSPDLIGREYKDGVWGGKPIPPDIVDPTQILTERVDELLKTIDGMLGGEPS